MLYTLYPESHIINTFNSVHVFLIQNRDNYLYLHKIWYKPIKYIIIKSMQMFIQTRFILNY